mmetsp:Transcript_41872/g.64089  ORF Transcript_41872/g.64089 Transcript_41872/m.64089 type:complete len:210 (-) Transcript_41872:1384-2013(-)
MVEVDDQELSTKQVDNHVALVGIREIGVFPLLDFVSSFVWPLADAEAGGLEYVLPEPAHVGEQRICLLLFEVHLCLTENSMTCHGDVQVFDAWAPNGDDNQIVSELGLLRPAFLHHPLLQIHVVESRANVDLVIGLVDHWTSLALLPEQPFVVGLLCLRDSSVFIYIMNLAVGKLIADSPAALCSVRGRQQVKSSNPGSRWHNEVFEVG